MLQFIVGFILGGNTVLIVQMIRYVIKYDLEKERQTHEDSA